MPHSTTPHTLSQQNRKLDRTDLEADQLEQTAGTDAQTYENRDVAQTGTHRAPQHFPDTASNLNTEPARAAYEGSLETRTPVGRSQGITSRSSDEESARQQKVVKDRLDAQAGINQNRK
jgi:hypothetical protein